MSAARRTIHFRAPPSRLPPTPPREGKKYAYFDTW